MSRSKELHDQEILKGISGSTDSFSCGVQIVEDYLTREKEENLLAEGIGKADPDKLRTSLEKDFWKQNMRLRELADQRFLRAEAKKEEQYEQEIDFYLQETGPVYMQVEKL
jgi:hypothetical protein